MMRTKTFGLLLAVSLIAVACGDGDTVFTTAAPATTTSAAVTTSGGAATPTTEAATTTTEAATTTTEAATTTTEAATTTTAAVTTTAGPIDCESPAQEILIGQTVDADLQPSGPYPGNATYYCVAVPQGVDRLTIDLGGFFVDLDLFVGFGSMESVQGVDLSLGETYEWKSNDFGTVDEVVVINGPQPGVYYIEIASYEGEPSVFTLSVSD